LDLVNCPVGAFLELLQERFFPSTLKVYMAALAAYHTPLSGVSLGRHPLMTRFMVDHGIFSSEEMSRMDLMHRWQLITVPHLNSLSSWEQPSQMFVQAVCLDFIQLWPWKWLEPEFNDLDRCRHSLCHDFFL